MKNLYHGLNSAMRELIWFLLLQGLFLFAFAVLVLFYPYFLVILVAFLLLCLAVLSFYFGIRVYLGKRKIDKIIKSF